MVTTSSLHVENIGSIPIKVIYFIIPSPPRHDPHKGSCRGGWIYYQVYPWDILEVIYNYKIIINIHIYYICIKLLDNNIFIILL